MNKEDIFDAMNTIDDVYIEEANSKKRASFKWTAMAAAVLLFILPNIHGNLASALSELPLVGQFFEVITIRTYEKHQSNRDVQIKIPQIEDNHTVTTELNKTVETYISEAIEYLENEGSYVKGMDIKYEVITDNMDWFTLKLDIFEVAASGYQRVMYYHIDKHSNQMVQLKDLFIDDTYKILIKDEILKLMAEEMESDENLIYFPEELEEINEDQNFYFNENNDLIIVFDEYAVAPGYMGVVSFKIDSVLYKDLLK
ncbi:MAG: DUF3298 domain-containing protein [Clostridia bacterium]|nr:DUF3298 domain-containing protein [Clostridia bacterium]